MRPQYRTSDFSFNAAQRELVVCFHLRKARAKVLKARLTMRHIVYAPDDRDVVKRP